MIRRRVLGHPGPAVLRSWRAWQPAWRRSDGRRHQDRESRDERLNRELIELLNELRVILPGVQVLFAFLLTIPFNQRFEILSERQKDVFYVAVLCTAASAILLIAWLWFAMPLARRARIGAHTNSS